ncbi:MAG: nitrous oxide reductase family maturation protein NosD [Sphingobacteriales bacterium]|nr:nitrous oxide reductase family maturation protein NosD [Sphingobacteriales bacterium]
MRSVFVILFLSVAFIASANTIVVGSNQPVTSLKKAIEIAHDKDTILIMSGIYKEGSVTLTKSLSIIGQNNTVLDGENKYEILLISGKNILIRGIQFRNSGYSALNDFASIKLVDCSNVVVENNTILNAYFAIHVSNSSFVTIRNNTITGSPKSEQLTGNGIHLWKSANALIENNHVEGQRDGIYFEFVSYSTIRNNRSEKNIRYGIHFMFSNDDVYLNNIFHDNGAGVAVMYSKKVRMEGNHFEQNWGPSAYGILLKDISDSYILHNTFFKNTVGIHMEGSSRMDIEKNVFKENGWAIKVQASCEDNRFHHNNFMGNSFDVGTNGSISLNTFYNNYWDKYEGYDINKDGTGDIPYHPVSMYSMIIEENPFALMLFRSFTVQLLDKAEKAIPSLTPENLVDNKPLIKPNKL